MVIIIICLLMGEKSKFKANNNNANLLGQFCQGRISKKFDYVESEEVSFKGNVMIFQLIKMTLINLTY